MIPREHGAWVMLLAPFFSALVLARRLTWEVIPALCAVLGLFLIREPLLAIARNRDVAAARRILSVWAIAIALAGGILLWRIRPGPVLALGLAAAGLTAMSVYLTVRNRQRSILLQVAGAAGLSSSALAAWLAVAPALDSDVWWLCGLQFAHNAAALLAVRARLETRIAVHQKRELYAMKRAAWAAQMVLLAAAAISLITGHIGPAIPLAFSGAIHSFDIARLRDPGFLAVPLRRVGLRELGISIAYSVVAVTVLW